jgi:eukaryotic-like serine/threonine-protein kinase
MDEQRFTHYRVIEKIGAGGMGVVYRAWDERLARDVAIKILPQLSIPEEQARKRFRKEALALSRLNHPNIETVFDFDAENGTDFIVMEYIAGVSLDEKLKTGPMAENEIQRLAIQLLDGLTAAHQQGIIHRDLKPANLRLTTDERLKILDFGLAKLIQPVSEKTASESLTNSEMVVGTLPYMSPEQLRDDPLDARSDIFTVGVILYEMATGERPFNEKTTPRLIDAILHRIPPAPRVLNGQVSEAMERIILRALQKEPERRYQSASTMHADLEKLSDVDSRAVTVGYPRWDKLPWLLAGTLKRKVITVTAMIIICMLIIMLWTGSRQPALSFAPRDWLLIADFDNQTGEDIFNKSLNTALNVSIGQSSHVNVLPSSRILGALRRMKKENLQRLDAATATEIAQREDVRLVLLPAITGVGGVYLLSAAIQDPHNGATLRSESVQAKGKSEVIKALDELSTKIRQDLGETRPAIRKQGKPLVEVTTASLDALKKYSLARDKLLLQKFDEARVLYEDALRIDPSFTAAKASLGMVNFEKFDREKGKELLADAVGNIDNLTEKEKYGILAFHATAVENNLSKAEGYHKSLIAMYPDDFVPHNNLGRVYLSMKNYDNALTEFKEAIKLNPYQMLSYFSLNMIYLNQFGELDEAIALCNKQISYNDRDPWAYDNLGWAYLGKGDLNNAEKAFRKALEIDPGLTLDMFRLAHTLRLQERYTEAIDILLRIPEIDPSEHSAYYDAGVVYQLWKHPVEAEKNFKRNLSEIRNRIQRAPDQAINYMDLGSALTRLGETKQGLAEAKKALSKDHSLQFEYACVLSAQGKIEEALDQMDLAIQNGFRNYIWMKIHPDLQSLHDTERFRSMLIKGLKTKS